MIVEDKYVLLRLIKCFFILVLFLLDFRIIFIRGRKIEVKGVERDDETFSVCGLNILFFKVV